MTYQMTSEQQKNLLRIHRLYMFVGNGETCSPEGMLDMILSFVDRHDNEFQEYLGWASNNTGSDPRYNTYHFDRELE